VPLRWLGTWRLPGKYKSRSPEQNWMVVCSLQTTLVTVRLLCSSHRVYPHLCKSFFVLPSHTTKKHPIEGQEKPTWQDHRNDDLNRNDMYDQWATECLRKKACGSEFYWLCKISCDSSNMENLPPMPRLATTNHAGTNNWDDDKQYNP
jgi:hypothetical protein